jgi:hypothetical protein
MGQGSVGSVLTGTRIALPHAARKVNKVIRAAGALASRDVQALCQHVPGGCAFLPGERGAPCCAGVPSKPLVSLPQLPAPVTAVAFSPRQMPVEPGTSAACDLLAVGLETGELQLWSVRRQADGASQISAAGATSPAVMHLHCSACSFAIAAQC